MLILSRKSGESLMIGDDVVVTVLDTTQNQIRIGISAPRDIAVHREEIYLKVLAEKSQQEQPNTPSNSQPQHMHEPTPAAMRIKA